MLSASEDSHTNRSLSSVPSKSEDSNDGDYEKNRTIPRSSSFFKPVRSDIPCAPETEATKPDYSVPRSSSTPRSTKSAISRSRKSAPISALPPAMGTTSAIPRSSSTPKAARSMESVTPKESRDDDDDRSVSSNYSHASTRKFQKGESLLDKSRMLGQAIKSRKQKEGGFNEKNMISQLDILHDRFTKMEMKSENFELCYEILSKYDSMMKFMAEKVMDNKNVKGKIAELENRTAALQVNNKICQTSYEEVSKANTALNETLSEKTKELDDLEENSHELVDIYEELKEKHQKLSNAYEAINNNMNEKEEENDCLRNEMNIMTDQTTAMKNALDSQKQTGQLVQDAIQELTASMEEQLESKDVHIEKVAKDLEESNSTIQALKDEILELKEISNEEKEEYEKHDQEIESQYQQTLSLFKLEIEMLKETIGKNEAFANSQIKEAHATNDKHKSQYEKEASGIEFRHQEEASSLKKQLNDIETQLGLEKKEHERLLNELEDKIRNNKKNQKRIEALEGDICDLNNQVTGFKEDKVSEEISRKTLVKEMIMETEAQQRLANDEIVELQQIIEIKDVEYEENKHKLIKLEESNREHLENLERLEELNKIQQKGMESEITKLRTKAQEERNTLRMHLSENRDEKEKLHNELVAAQQLNSKMEEKLLTKREEVYKLTEELDAKESEADQVAQDLKLLTEENAKQQQTMEQIRDLLFVRKER